jgi:hypothetical protein
MIAGSFIPSYRYIYSLGTNEAAILASNVYRYVIERKS